MLRTLQLSGRTLRTSVAAVAFATSAATLVGCRRSFSSGAEENSSTAPVKVAGVAATLEEKKANDLIWEEKAKSCPLCRLFLESPCAEEFKLFSDCSDRAKAMGKEVSEVCGDSDFAKMRKCMMQYPEHFEDLFAAEEAIVSDDDDDEDEVAEGSEESRTPPISGGQK